MRNSSSISDATQFCLIVLVLGLWAIPPDADTSAWRGTVTQRSPTLMVRMDTGFHTHLITGKWLYEPGIGEVVEKVAGERFIHDRSREARCGYEAAYWAYARPAVETDLAFASAVAKVPFALVLWALVLVARGVRRRLMAPAPVAAAVAPPEVEARVAPTPPQKEPRVAPAAAVEPAAPGACQVCGAEMTADVVACSLCDTRHHGECFAWAGACATYGCGSNSARPVKAAA